MDLLSLEWRITYDNFHLKRVWWSSLREYLIAQWLTIWTGNWKITGYTPCSEHSDFSEFTRVILTRICNRKQSEVQFLFSERSKIYQAARGYQVV